MFSNLLAEIGLAALKAEARVVLRRVGIGIAVGALTGLLFLTALGLALAALIVWLAGEIGTIWALLAVAGVLILIAVIVQLVTRSRKSAPRRARVAMPPPPPRQPTDDVEPDEDAETIEMPPPGSALGAAAVVAAAGFLLARQMLRPRR